MTPYVALQHLEDVFLLPTRIGSKVFATEGRSEFVVLERACVILRGEGGFSGRDTIVDVGAHIGTTTIPALSRQGFVRAVAIEPDPAHLPLLRANVALNQFEERVTVVAAALSDASRLQQPFSQGSRKGVDRWMKGRLAHEPSQTTVAVSTVTLNGLAEAGMIDPATTGLLWFDCGSCEEHALQSASLFFEHRVPLVFPLRRRQFSRPGPLLARLRGTYENVVDLRSPRLAEPTSTWTPTVRPVDDLVRLLPEGKKLTDVLLF